MNVRINIDTKTFVRFWLVVIGFGLAALMLIHAQTAFIIILVSFFLSLALNPPVSWLARYMPGNSRIGGTAIAFILVVVFLGAFIFLVVPPIVDQTTKLAQAVPGLVTSATDQYRGLDQLIDRYNLQPQVDSALGSIKENANQWAANLGQTLITGVGSFFRFMVALLIVLVMSFLMLIEGPTWLNRLWDLYVDKGKMTHHRDILQKMYKTVTGYVTGQLTVSAIGAAMSGITVFILSLFLPIDSGLSLPAAAISFVFSLIPMFGATIAGILITALLAFNSITAAVIFLAFFVIYQQVENNFVSPVIQSRTLDLSALVVLVSVTIGIYMFGILGGIISIPIAGCIKILLGEYLSSVRRKRTMRQSPLKKLTKKLTEAAE